METLEEVRIGTCGSVGAAVSGRRVVFRARDSKRMRRMSRIQARRRLDFVERGMEIADCAWLRAELR